MTGLSGQASDFSLSRYLIYLSAAVQGMGIDSWTTTTDHLLAAWVPVSEGSQRHCPDRNKLQLLVYVYIRMSERHQARHIHKAILFQLPAHRRQSIESHNRLAVLA